MLRSNQKVRPLSKSPNVVALLVRGVLIVAALSTYLVSPDDVVWRFIKTTPRARLWEHVAFGTAAVILGISLFLKLLADISARKQDARGAFSTRMIAAFLQAIGIGSLLPLPGFLLFVLGDLTINLLLSKRAPKTEDASSGTFQVTRLSPLTEHIGLCCAFVSMLVFSIVLIDRVADVLFAVTAAVSLAISCRNIQHAEDRCS